MLGEFRVNPIPVARFFLGLPAGFITLLSVAEGFSLAGVHLNRLNNFEKLIHFLEEHPRILLTTHINPDPDGLGSQLALAHVLLARGHQVKILNPGPEPAHLRFLDPDGLLASPAGVDHDWYREKCLVVSLDNSETHRLGKIGQWLREQNPAPFLIIDHHKSPPAYPPGTTAFIDPSYGATAEIIFYLIRYWQNQAGDKNSTGALTGKTLSEDDWKQLWSRKLATPLYAGLVADTGSFRFRATRPRSHRMAAFLVEQGVEPHLLQEKLFQNYSWDRPRLKARLYQNMVLEPEIGLGLFVLANSDLLDPEKPSTTFGQLEGVVNELLDTSAVLAAVLAVETKSGAWKMSLRTRGELDAAGFAARFGGGGHLNAAGFTWQPNQHDREREPADAGPVLPRNLYFQLTQWVKDYHSSL